MTKDQNKPLFTISTAADLLGISLHTLRMYEREGLIIPHKKKSGQCLYSRTDIERIESIRAAINVFKISISGIKRILSLVPCWSLTECSVRDLENCTAFNGHLQPCWTYNHKTNICATHECRECIVYQEYSDCGRVKEQLRVLLT